MKGTAGVVWRVGLATIVSILFLGLLFPMFLIILVLLLMAWPLLIAAGIITFIASHGDSRAAKIAFNPNAVDTHVSNLKVGDTVVSLDYSMTFGEARGVVQAVNYCETHEWHDNYWSIKVNGKYHKFPDSSSGMIRVVRGAIV